MCRRYGRRSANSSRSHLRPDTQNKQNARPVAHVIGRVFFLHQHSVAEYVTSLIEYTNSYFGAFGERRNIILRWKTSSQSMLVRSFSKLSHIPRVQFYKLKETTMKKREMSVVLIWMACAFVPTAYGQSTNLVPPQIQNMISVQRAGSMLVDVTYDLIDPDSSVVFMSGVASTNGGTTYNIMMSTVSGDAGWVTPGTGKKLVWNPWVDLGAGQYTTNAKVRLTADDSDSANGPTPTNSPGPNLTWIPSGTFNMSGTFVYLTHGYWMGKYEVTQNEFMQLMSSNPSAFHSSSNLPVDSVTWFEATTYCSLLTAREQTAGHISSNQLYRLPTEAEWEYACRAHSTNTYYFGDDAGALYAKLSSYAWIYVNSGQTSSGGLKIPNRWGLYDMIGNVQEWCSDWYASLPGGSVLDPTGPSSGSNRVARGAGWLTTNGAEFYSADRRFKSPSTRGSDAGFRVVLTSGL